MGTSTELKLKSAGESVTMACTRCEPLSIGQWPEVEFEGLDGNRSIVVRVPKKSADRQLEREALTYADCVGSTVTLSRDHNREVPTKPYWGVTVRKTAGKAPSSPAKAAPEPPPPDDRDAPEDVPTPARTALNAKFALYDECFRHAAQIALQYDAQLSPLACAPLDVSAMAATLYIQASR